MKRRSEAKATYLALAVLPDGTRDILGLWIEQTEGAKFWMKVFSDLRTRGCQDILIAVYPATQLPSYPATQLLSHPATQPPSYPATQRPRYN